MLANRRKTFLADRWPLHLTLYDILERATSITPLTMLFEQKGPEIRTGNTPGDKDIPIAAGLELNMSTDDKYASASDDKNL